MAIKILICDDALFMRKILKDMLAKLNYEVCGEAHDPKEAVEKYKELKPDLVTMDIVMPETNGLNSGIDATKEIIKIDPKAKIIMITAMGQQKLVAEAIEAGAHDFIVKPFQEGKVIEAVKKAVGG